MLDNLQIEIKAWTLKNFNQRSAVEPLLGITEEYGELCAAKTDEQRKDAVADIAIFAIDFCANKNWSVEAIVSAEKDKTLAYYSDYYLNDLGICVGKLSHHYLKQLQGIRGTASQHDLHMQDAIGKLFLILEGFSDKHSFNFWSNLNTVWLEVSKRDWNKARANGDSNEL